MLNKAIKDFVSGTKLYHVWLYQAHHGLSSKYKRTILGPLWVSGNMVFTSIAVAIVFGALFGRDLQEALPYMMAGNLSASMAMFMLTDGPEVYMKNGNIIKNHAYPFTFFIYESVASTVILFFHNVVVFYIAMLILGTLSVPHWSIILGLPIVILSIFAWGGVTGMLAARYRDLRFLLPYLSSLLFFLTPIYWHVEHLSESRRFIADANPIYGMVSVIRMPLLGQAPTAAEWTSALVFMSAGIVVWVLAFTSLRKRIPFWL